MKHLALTLGMMALLTALGVQAKHNLGGGFTGPGTDSSSVAEVLKMRDDAPVTLNGHIEKQLGGDHYLFKDATGTITVEIDDDEWGGLNVTPTTPVTISGEVDKDWTSLKVDVKTIRLTK